MKFSSFRRKILSHFAFSYIFNFCNFNPCQKWKNRITLKGLPCLVKFASFLIAFRSYLSYKSAAFLVKPATISIITYFRTIPFDIIFIISLFRISFLWLQDIFSWENPIILKFTSDSAISIYQLEKFVNPSLIIPEFSINYNSIAFL